MSVKKPTLFNFLDQISNKSTKYKYDKKVAPAYMLSLWLSHDPQLLPIVQRMNFLQFSLPDKVIYDYYCYSVPKRRKRYIKWTKKTPEDKKKVEVLESIREEYGVSKNEAKRILLYKERLENGKNKRNR